MERRKKKLEKKDEFSFSMCKNVRFHFTSHLFMDSFFFLHPSLNLFYYLAFHHITVFRGEKNGDETTNNE